MDFKDAKERFEDYIIMKDQDSKENKGEKGGEDNKLRAEVIADEDIGAENTDDEITTYKTYKLLLKDDWLRCLQ